MNVRRWALVTGLAGRLIAASKTCMEGSWNNPRQRTGPTSPSPCASSQGSVCFLAREVMSSSDGTTRDGSTSWGSWSRRPGYFVFYFYFLRPSPPRGPNGLKSSSIRSAMELLPGAWSRGGDLASAAETTGRGTGDGLGRDARRPGDGGCFGDWLGQSWLYSASCRRCLWMALIGEAWRFFCLPSGKAFVG